MNVRPLVDAIFREQFSLPSGLDALQFLSKRHTSVYRVVAGGSTYIVHVTSQGTEDLTRIKSNLCRLESLPGNQIPRVLAFRNSGPETPVDQRWALLVMTDIPGAELDSRRLAAAAWSSLCDLLQRIHALPAERERGSSVSRRIDDPAGFTDFATTFALHLSELPLGLERVRAHLGAMAEYVERWALAFAVEPRLIHGDINRQNVRVQGDCVGIIDWADLGPGDYAYDLATLKFALDSVVPNRSAALIRELARVYRRRFGDDTLELRLRFFLALPGLVSAFWYANESALFPAARAWRVRTCYLHSEAQWKTPLRLDGSQFDSPVIPTEHWALRIPQPARGLFYLLAPKRVA